MSVKKKKNHYSDMTFFFRKETNFVVHRASCFLANSDVESDSEGVQKKKRKRVVIYSESDGEDESDDEGPRAKSDVKAKNDEIGIIVEKSL